MEIKAKIIAIELLKSWGITQEHSTIEKNTWDVLVKHVVNYIEYYFTDTMQLQSNQLFKNKMRDPRYQNYSQLLTERTQITQALISRE